MNPEETAYLEFSQNYKAYLENKFLYTLLSDTIASSSSSSTSTSAGDKENFAKLFGKFFLGNDAEDPNNGVLSNETKTHLVNKIESKLESYFTEIDNYLKFFKSDAEDSSPSRIDDFHVNSDKVCANVKCLLDSMKADKSRIEKLNQEIDGKLQLFANHLMEAMQMAKKILKEFKLDFYANMSSVELSHEILSCDYLFKKINQLESEMMSDLYTPEKLSCLQTIKSQIELDRSKLNESWDMLSARLGAYKRIGKEMDQVLAVYSDLKSQYERKKYTIEKIKGDEIIF